jgi:hypothetical protein
MTEAKIGPTQGVHNKPKDKPTIIPPPKPGLGLTTGTKLESLEKACSKSNWTLGTNKDKPNIKTTIIDRDLRLDPVIPRPLTIPTKKSVKNVKLDIKPIITPIGRCELFGSPPKEDDKIIGSMGKIHGDKIVTKPAKKANKQRRIIHESITGTTTFDLVQNTMPQN